MLKHKFARIAASVACLAAIFFVSCKSTPKPETISPFSLLSSDNVLYVHVPVQYHKEFVKEALIRMMDADENDAGKISSRIRDLYIGNRSVSGFEISALGNFPENVLKLSLTEKKGWKSKKFQEYNYYLQNSTGIQLSIPTIENAIISSNVEEMLGRIKDNSEGAEANVSEDLLEYLTSDISEDIRFISPSPNLFFKSFFGANLTLGIEKIKGAFSSNSSKKNEYDVKLILEMADPRTVKAGTRILQLAFSNNAKISQTGESQITVSDLTFTWDEILALISN